MLTFAYPRFLPLIILLCSAALALLIAYVHAGELIRRPKIGPRLSSAIAAVRPDLFMCTAVGLIAAMFVILTLLRHRAFATGADLAIYDQAVWLLSRGRQPFVTVRGLHAFGDHTAFILLLIAPLYRVFDTPDVLLVLQSVVVPVGAVPLYWLARERMPNGWLPVSIALAYLLHPGTGYVMSFDFHPEALAMPLVLFALYFGLRGEAGRLALFSSAAALCKEDVALTVFAMGGYLAWQGQRRLGVWTSVIALGWFALSMLVILPFFNSSGAFYTNLYPTGGSPGT